VSPILTRPVREQLEHDRVIRQLQTKYKRSTDVIINPGNEQNQSVTVGDLVVFPDVLVFAEGTRRLLTTVEVETGESVNPIEARAEWGVYSKLRVPLHLYVPAACVDATRRICDEYQIVVSELWTYTTSFDQVRFTMVYRSPDAPTVKVPVKSASAVAKAKAKPAAPARQAQGRPDRSTGTRSPGQGMKPKPVAQGRPEPGRATKAKPAVKSKPVAKPTLAAKKSKSAPTLRHAQGRPEPSRGAKAKSKPAKKGGKKR
jgi:hypothetical protein